MFNPADNHSVTARLRNEEGFGLIELLISIVMLNVGILAIVAAFNAGTLAIHRASQTGTAATLAEKQMELYRAQLWSNIALDSGSKTAASANSTYNTDTAYNATQVVKTCSTPLSNFPQCEAMRTVTGPDNISYRVDSYIVSEIVAGGRPVKRVTVVVRRASTLKTLARLTSSFDESTGI